jgi:hypothetical protein
MLGGAQSDNLFKHLHLVLEELSDEREHNEP